MIMPPGLYGQRLTLMEELKAATSLAHAQLQTTPFFVALPACQLPLESYVGQLRALAVIHAVLEPALAASSHPALVAVWRADMRKTPWLEQDLRYFAPRAVADLKEAVDEALRVAEQMRLWSVERPLRLLGAVYVLEGSTLGGVLLGRQCARAFLLADHAGLAYLNSYGPAVPAHWAEFRERMNALSLDGAEREAVRAGAVEFFAGLAAVFRALYPVRPESKTWLATTINPEAGRHPVPAEPAEVEAALRAADRCWTQFPYFSARYGERGRRFARSDGAWLATLGQYEPAVVREQVRWLGRLLAARGMPTLLLATQLDLLGAELTAACPEKRAAYEQLLAAAADLHRTRARWLSDAAQAELSAAFDRAVGREWSQRLPATGRLLAAAVADEAAGNAGAVEALKTWLSDGARFPAVWTAAVETILAHARQLSREGL